MHDGKIIDAEFVVIERGRNALPPSRAIPRPRALGLSPGGWSFLHDDLPNIAGIAAALAVAFGFAMFARPAHGQTTQCQPTIVGMPSAGVTCRTDAQPVAGQAYSWRDVPPKPCSNYQRAFPDNHSMCAARDVATARKAVGDLVAAGKCDEAMRGALGTGDLDFARDVRSYCAGK